MSRLKSCDELNEYKWIHYSNIGKENWNLYLGTISIVIFKLNNLYYYEIMGSTILKSETEILYNYKGFSKGNREYRYADSCKSLPEAKEKSIELAFKYLNNDIKMLAKFKKVYKIIESLE